MDSRLPQELVVRQAEELARNSALQGIFQLLPYLVLVLNKQRQIIYSNNGLLQVLGIVPLHERLGCRPGEMLRCIHSCKTPGGCGTTAYCTVCGANTAILEVQQTGQPVYRECLLTTSADGQHTESHELSIHAMPAGQSNPDAVLFMIRDISEEKRKKVLEQLFLHDLLNSAGAARGFMELTHMTEDLPELQELCGCAKDAVEVIIGEIENHRDLLHAEKGELEVNPEPVDLNGLIRAVADSVQNGAEQTVDIRLEGEEELAPVSDPILLRRVVTNMVKNAAEASGEQPVRIRTGRQGSSITIDVHNKVFMPPEIQLQVFKRSFSTKGEGRGYGTYGMKLFGERYLGGEVRFHSSPESGTLFTFILPEDYRQSQGNESRSKTPIQHDTLRTDGISYINRM